MTLSEIGEKHGTDKGTLHSYLDLYEIYLGSLKEKPISLLEIGIGGGASIRMWQEFFPRGTIVGIDNNKDSCKNAPVSFCIDQADAEQIRWIFSNQEFDIIIDDGSHDPKDQILSFHYLWHCLKSRGLYFVEDIRDEQTLDYWAGMNGVTVYCNKKNGREDDILVAIQKT